MAQDLLTITPEAFELQLYKLSVGSLKNLCIEVYSFIGRNAEKLKFGQICDLERKQTKIWKELQRRGVLNNNNNQEFMNWLYSKKEKKYY